MKPAFVTDRDLKPANGVVVVRRVATHTRRAKLVRLLSMLLDKPDTPEEEGRP